MIKPLPIFYHATQDIKTLLGREVLSPAKRIAGMMSHQKPNPLLKQAAFTHKSPVIIAEEAYYGGQRPGFFVFNNPKAARHAIDPRNEKTIHNPQHITPASVIGVQPHTLEGWRPDYELHGVEALKHVIEQPINGKTAKEFLLGRQTQLHGETYTISKATDDIVQFKITGNGRTRLSAISHKRNDPGDYMIKDAPLVQATWDIIERDAPQHFHELNKKMVEKLLQKENAALKYVGNEPLPIVSRETFMDGDWRPLEPQYAAKLRNNSKTIEK